MKKLIAVVAFIVIFLVGGLLLVWYFNDNLKDYNAYAEFETVRDAEYFFMENAFAEQTGLGVAVYTVSDDGKVSEIFADMGTGQNIVYAQGDYIVLQDINGLSVYHYGESFTKVFEVFGSYSSAHQYGEYFCLRVVDVYGNVVIYRYLPGTEVVNVTAEQDFDFVDYCIDPILNKEYFVSYVLTGEYVRISIITCSNGVVSPEAFVELDDMVYNEFEYINNMFVFYTDTSMIFINAQNQVRRIQHVYDMDKVKKIKFDDKLVYYMDNAYFNGVDNVCIVTPSASTYANMVGYDDVARYTDRLVFRTDKYVKQYTFNGIIINEHVLFSDEEMLSIDVMGNSIAVTKADKIVFMKTNR